MSKDKINLILPQYRYNSSSNWGISTAGVNYRPELELHFANDGELTVPSKPGCYVIAPGCGSGKTTLIRMIIASQAANGVLYAAATIKECNEMYEYCKSIVGEDKVVMFHSNINDPGVNNNLLRSNSDELLNKQVVICTHHKLLHESPEILLKYNVPEILPGMMSPQRRAMVGNAPKIRQNILIDELPTCDGLSVNLTLPEVKSLGAVLLADIVQVTFNGATYNRSIPIPNKGKDKWYNMGYTYDQMVEMYKSDRHNLPGLGRLTSRSNESQKLKVELILGKLYDNFTSIVNYFYDLSKDSDTINLEYGLSDLVFNDVSTRFMIFDGTGDLTFKYDDMEDRRFEVLTYKDKYSSPITLTKIKFGVKRYYKGLKSFMNDYPSILKKLDDSIGIIRNLLGNGRRVLIVTWMGFKVKDNDDPGSKIFMTCPEYNESFTLTDYLKYCINTSGFIEDINYSVIHYQSGLDKATNQFRDYDTVVFLGEFHVPDEVITKFNINNRTITSPEEYQRYQLVQAVCRTRIRNHEKEPIEIVYTDDWEDEVMINLVKYLTGSDEDHEIRNTTMFDDIKPKWKDIIKKLCELSYDVRDAILISSHTCSITLTLDEMYEFMPKSRKCVESYFPLINYLRKFGIELVIDSPSVKFTSENNPRKKSKK